MIAAKIIISIFCIVGIIKPELTWKISEGWKFKNVEPSDVYLNLNRIASAIVLFIVWFIIP
jgi:hypothetical protein